MSFSTTAVTSPKQKKTSRKNVFQRMWDRYSISGQQRRIELAERLFRAAHIRAHDPLWYGPGRIDRDFRSRHALLTMHVWFLHKRLIEDDRDHDFALLVQEELFDIFWHDTTSRIRNEKVHEWMVNKHLKDVQQITFQHLTHYDHAYSFAAEDTRKRFEEVAALIWIHIFKRDEEHLLDDQLRRLALYIEVQQENIVRLLPSSYFWEGRIAWIDIPNFEGMRNRQGEILPTRPVHSEDFLPPQWFLAHTDAGRPYYWNPTIGKSQWEKPTTTQPK